MAVAAGTSPSSCPHSSIGRLEVMRVERFWCRRTISFQQRLCAFGREVFHAKVVDAEQVRFEIFGQCALGFSWRLVVLHFANEVEDGAVEGNETGADRGVAERLGQKAFCPRPVVRAAARRGAGE